MLTLVGSAIWDYVLALEDLPVRGSSTHAQFLGGNPGGCAPNSAAVAASLDEKVTLITRVGKDEIGRHYQELCRQIPSLSVIWLPADGPTKLSINFITPDGERTLVSASPPDGTAPAVDITEEVTTQLAQTDLLWVMAGRVSKRNLYPSFCSGKRGIPLEHFREELELRHHWDYVVGSSADADTPELTDLQTMGVELCVITKGAAGGVYSQAGDPWIPFSSHPVTHVIDACGAGDAFLGGLLVGLYRQLPVEETIFLASTCGALAVTQQGSWPLPIL